MKASIVLQILHKQVRETAEALKHAQKQGDVAQSNFYLGQQNGFVFVITLLNEDVSEKAQKSDHTEID